MRHQTGIARDRLRSLLVAGIIFVGAVSIVARELAASSGAPSPFAWIAAAAALGSLVFIVGFIHRQIRGQK